MSHATLEPHNCTADFRDGEVWVRGPIQMPMGVPSIVSRATGIEAAKVHVHSTRIGGGFGRRLMSDYAAEAAVVAKAIGGAVMVIDNREGDLQHDYYRPAAMQRLRAGLDAAGRIVAWDHVIASCSRNAYRKDPGASTRPKPTAATSGGFEPSSSWMPISNPPLSRMRDSAMAHP